MTALDARPAAGGARVPAGPLGRCTGLDLTGFAPHWSRTPLLTRGAGPFDDLLSTDDVDQLVAERGLREPFFRLVDHGAGAGAATRTVTAGNRRIADLADPTRVSDLHLAGATLVLQSLHRLHPPVARLCRELAAELGHPTQCNAYVTPSGRAQGFDLHHDTHDVFVLQVSGRKRWVVHAPVQELPLPSQPQAGAHLVPDGQPPLLDVELVAGDCLYLPRGYVHAAVTTDEHSVHLTVGVLSTTWYDVLGDAVGLAAEELWARDALPLSPAGADLDLPAFLRRAADWLAGLPPEELADRLAQRLARAAPPEPLRMLAQAEAVARLQPDTVVRPRPGLAARVVDDALVLPDRTVSLPAVALPAVRVLLAGPATPRSLAQDGLGLDEDDALVLVRRLLREGALVPA